jgi:hypothetical protein
MNHRDNLLAKAWTKAPLTIGGKNVCLSPVRYATLEQWENPLFVGSTTGGGAILAMAETLLVCTATHKEFYALTKMTKEERTAAVFEYMVENEDEISAAASLGLQEQLEPIRAAMVESELPGKGEQVHVS